MGDLAQRLVHDAATGEVRDGPRRYLLMRADVFSGAIALAPAEQRPAMLAAFAQSVAEQGADSVRAYLDALGGDRSALLAMMPAAAADLAGVIGASGSYTQQPRRFASRSPTAPLVWRLPASPPHGCPQCRCAPRLPAC